ncbi:hypothetical protein SCHPADRAFT_925150 [Schizopora paradoxa]|uniref:Zn(2)-C6 fungal-type domain-containing protein n=1 Tax=Schizopora paradoxa TaxID=27342 RepID=A0A0H2SMJ9_9AGAM|nr:hypothetical protein SCHPADRAFT_925150 [Schizopora paradoxa]
MSSSTSTTSTLNARTVDEIPKKNTTPCASCRYHHKKCEGGYPCNRCKPDRQKARICFASTRPPQNPRDDETSDAINSEPVTLQLPTAVEDHRLLMQPSSASPNDSIIVSKNPAPNIPQASALYATSAAQPYGYSSNYGIGQQYPVGSMDGTNFPASSHSLPVTTNFNGQFALRCHQMIIRHLWEDLLTCPVTRQCHLILLQAVDYETSEG